MPPLMFFVCQCLVRPPRKIMYSYNQNKFIGSSIKNKIKLNFEKSLTGCREMVFSVFVSANISAWSPVLPIQPRYRLAHPENYLFSLSKKIFSGSKYPKNIKFNFEKRSTNERLLCYENLLEGSDCIASTDVINLKINRK